MTSACLQPLSGATLPAWCDCYLDTPAAGDLFASRLWYEVVLAAALPPGAVPQLGVSGALLLPLVQVGQRVRALVTDYTPVWRPLAARGVSEASLETDAAALAGLLRGRRPVLLDALAADAPGLKPLLRGLRSAGIIAAHYAHFGNWHQPLALDVTWDAWLAERPPALRTTIRRKLARATREFTFERILRPGRELEAGIAAYEAVRAASWKPLEPCPGFDAVLLRALASAGALRLGVLWQAGRPVAAQYWALDGAGSAGRRRATVLKLAHAEDARAASPGTALTALMVRGLLEEDGVRELDFGRGDDAYKRLWVAQRRQRVGFLVADPRHPAGLLALVRHAGGRLRRYLRRDSA